MNRLGRIIPSYRHITLLKNAISPSCRSNTESNNINSVHQQFTRKISTSYKLSHGDYEWEDPKSPEDVVNMTYIDRDDQRHEIKAKVGDNVLFLAHRHDIDIEGACEAALV